MDNAEPLPTELTEMIRKVSGQLLGLHKLLLELERGRYEAEHGPVSPGELLNLVLNHDQFGWLRSLSGLIVELDEAVAPRSKTSTNEAEIGLKQVGSLLVPAEDGSTFQHKYWRALQDSPDVIFAHREILETVNAAS